MVVLAIGIELPNLVPMERGSIPIRANIVGPCFLGLVWVRGRLFASNDDLTGDSRNG
jgi:hypothetical protein